MNTEDKTINNNYKEVHSMKVSVFEDIKGAEKSKITQKVISSLIMDLRLAHSQVLNGSISDILNQFEEE